ncbi:hypothetical protein BG261_02510 [Floricoccus tropicus]|uniref:Probable multidrug resistance protein NorM n=1 Tax=Floricoccus tropicus TaxID=1859473 RepID=A0A1E8GMJ0_9LACT|nr:MATE family efflux transporter [Floricoccus tropicus]OFI49469.1 hypothetical protein BG261_02510 [Floricoccus tropicus]
MNENAKKLLKFSIPAILENVLQTTVGFVDAFLIAKISLLAVSAVSMANGVLAVYQAVCIALAVAVSTIISNYLGAKDMKTVSSKSAASLKLSLILGIILGLFSIFLAKPIFQLMGASGEVLEATLPFFQIVAGASILMILLSVFGGLVRSTGDSRSPLYINLVVNILNFLFDLVLIFGLLGFPKLGIVGSAIGTCLARLIGVIFLFLRVQRTPARIKKEYLFGKTPMKDLVFRAIPIMGERLTMRMGDLVIFAIIIAYGSQVFAGNSIGETITAYNYLAGMGMATGVAIMVAREYGQKNIADIKSITKAGHIISGILSTIIGGVIFFAGPYITGLFTTDAVAAQAAMVVLLVSFISEPIVSGVLIYTASLQAMGDAKTPFIATSIGMWIIRIALAYVLGTVFNMQILGVWLATLIDNVFRFIVLKIVYSKKVNTQ